MCRSLPASQDICELQIKVNCSKHILCWVVLPAPKGCLHLGWHSSVDMSSIYCPNTILHVIQHFFSTWYAPPIMHNYLWHWFFQYLKIRIPSGAVSDLKWRLARWRFNHLMPKFPNSIQYFLEVPTHCLNRPPPALVYNSKTLVMADHMKKHCNLLFYTAMYAIS